METAEYMGTEEIVETLRSIGSNPEIIGSIDYSMLGFISAQMSYYRTGGFRDYRIVFNSIEGIFEYTAEAVLTAVRRKAYVQDTDYFDYLLERNENHSTENLIRFANREVRKGRTNCSPARFALNSRTWEPELVDAAIDMSAREKEDLRDIILGIPITETDFRIKKRSVRGRRDVVDRIYHKPEKFEEITRATEAYLNSLI